MSLSCPEQVIKLATLLQNLSRSLHYREKGLAQTIGENHSRSICMHWMCSYLRVNLPLEIEGVVNPNWKFISWFIISKVSGKCIRECIIVSIAKRSTSYSWTRKNQQTYDFRARYSSSGYHCNTIFIRSCLLGGVIIIFLQTAPSEFRPITRKGITSKQEEQKTILLSCSFC